MLLTHRQRKEEEGKVKIIIIEPIHTSREKRRTLKELQTNTSQLLLVVQLLYIIKNWNIG